MEPDKHIGKAAMTMSGQTKRVGTNGNLTEHIKIQVYRACVLRTLLRCSDSWTL